MEIVQLNNSEKPRFQAIESGSVAGEMLYTWQDTKSIIITHTEVNNAFKGQGIGKELVLAAVNFARKNTIKIIPLCSFVKNVFEKKIDIQDVL